MNSCTVIGWPRVGLLGNPSDGYGGAALAFTFDAFAAEVRVVPTDEPGFRIAEGETSRWVEAGGLRDAVSTGSVDGLAGLVGASLVVLDDRLSSTMSGGLLERGSLGLSLTVSTGIPRQVGLSGSSAVTVAALRALDGALVLGLEPGVLAGLALEAERRVLGITCGPLDRIIQVLGGGAVSRFRATPASYRLDTHRGG